jgi:hypothetical protein
MKQLIFYCFSAIVLLQGCSSVNEPDLETIVYIDLGDVKIGYNQTFIMDIDADGNAEFFSSTLLIANEVGDHLNFLISPYRYSQVQGNDNRMAILNESEQIKEGNLFFKDLHPLAVKTITQNESYWSGEWMNAERNYAGIRFRLKGQGYHYGWVRMSVDKVNDVLIIHDMAYHSIQNSGIKAGEL